MNKTINKPSLSPVQLAAYLCAALSLWLVLKGGLLLALFSGLLVFSLVHGLAPSIEKRFNRQRPRLVALALLTVALVLVMTAVIWGMHVFVRNDTGNVSMLLQKLADMIEASKAQLPEWISSNFPEDVGALQNMLTHMLREHAGEAKVLLPEAGHVVAHLLLGMIIGGMVAMHEAVQPADYPPFASALLARLRNLAAIFRKIVFAQVQISLINTILTSAYLLIILPAMGVHLPLIKTMIVLTFLFGMIPVMGNIVSNTILVIVALSYSLNIAVASLVFMIVIHKAEYFLNAKIIGVQVNAKAWELLTAMLVFESLFGIPGVVAAPVFYAYIKLELQQKGLV